MKKQDDETNNAEDAGAEEAGNDKQAHDGLRDDELTPSDEKIGERPDNLSRRSDWFQKRTGGR